MKNVVFDSDIVSNGFQKAQAEGMGLGGAAS